MLHSIMNITWQYYVTLALEDVLLLFQIFVCGTQFFGCNHLAPVGISVTYLFMVWVHYLIWVQSYLIAFTNLFFACS